MPDKLRYDECDCKVDNSNLFMQDQYEVGLVQKCIRRPLESRILLRLSSPPKDGCHNYIRWGNIHLCDNPRRREEYLKQHI
jgi:hypothetical protein